MKNFRFFSKLGLLFFFYEKLIFIIESKKKCIFFHFFNFTEKSTELIFERNLIDVWNTEFLTNILNILDSPDFFGCILKLRYELRFDAREFVHVNPWLFSTSFATPNIPSNLPSNDYRSIMFTKAYENPYANK